MKRHTGRERRKGFRKALSFGTDIVRVNRITFKTKWDDETGVNLGLAGFCCYSSRKLPDKTNISCLIGFLPPHDQQLVEAEAKLIWQKQITKRDQRVWYHGFEFTKIHSTHRKFIEQVIKVDC